MSINIKYKAFGFDNSNGIISKVQVWDSQKESED